MGESILVRVTPGFVDEISTAEINAATQALIYAADAINRGLPDYECSFKHTDGHDYLEFVKREA